MASPGTEAALSGAKPSSERVALPAIFLDSEMLLPVKIDITFKGGRYVDSMCISIKSTAFAIYELCWQTCADLNLPTGFLWRMYLQLREQIVAYRDIVETFLSLNELPQPNYPDISSLQPMTVAVRNNTTDYSDKFTWDMSTGGCSPEDFARITCADLGLPPEMEPAISHRIRENVIRTFLSWFEDKPPTTAAPAVAMSPAELWAMQAEIKVSQVSAKQAVDMVTNLWKRAKPFKIDDQTVIPLPKLPSKTDSNADVWMENDRHQDIKIDP